MITHDSAEQLAARIAELEEQLEQGQSVEAASELARLKAELDRLLSELKKPLVADAFESESNCGRVTDLVKQIGRDTCSAVGEPTLPSGLAGAAKIAESGEKSRQGKGGNSSGQVAPPKKVVRLGAYELISKLGQGGMGAVYKARHVRLDKIVAIKVLPPKRVQDKATVARFEREMRAVGKLDHENIVRAMDAGEVDGRHFLVMEYVSGIDLSKLVKKLGPLPIADACELIRQAAVGLDEAHAHGMVHRDIKPSNIMLCQAGGRKQPPVVKILDMGLALLSDAHTADVGLTSTGQLMGTLDYMAPEQGGDSKNVDIRADLYALGASLYRLLTGEVIFHGDRYQTPVQKMMALATEDAPAIQSRRADVPEGLANIIGRLLEKNPAARFATPEEVIAALTPYGEGANLGQMLVDVGLQPAGLDDAKTGTVPNASAASVHASDLAPRPLSGLQAQGASGADAVPSFVGPPPAWAQGVGGKSVRRQRRFPTAIAVGLGVAAAAVIAAVAWTLLIQTPEGTLRVEINDPQVEVRVAGNDVVLKKAGRETIQLTPGEHVLVVQRGDFRFETTKLALKEGGTETVKVDWLPGQVQVVHQGRIIGQKSLEGSTPVVGANPPPIVRDWQEDDMALAFDGHSSLVQLSGVEVDLARPITWEAWVFPQAEQGEGAVFGCDAFPLRQTPQGWSLAVMTSPRVSQAKGKWEAVPDPPAVEVDKWQHLAGVWNPEKNEMLLFVNGKLSRRRTVAKAESDGPSPVFLGGHPLFVGRISRVRISSNARYDHDFTPSKSLAGDSETLAMYRFEEGSGEVLKDTSGRGHDGKILNANWVKVNAPLPRPADPPQEIDLLLAVDTAALRYSNFVWRREGAKIVGEGTSPKSVSDWRGFRFPTNLAGDYDVEIDFQQRGFYPLQIDLPLGDRAIRLSLSPGGSSLMKIDGKDDNQLDAPFRQRDTRLKSGVIQQLRAQVRHSGDNVKVDATLDGQPVGSFDGLRSRISLPHWIQPDKTRITGAGLCDVSKASMTIERALYRPLASAAENTLSVPTKPAPFKTEGGVPHYHELWQIKSEKPSPHSLAVFPDGKRLLVGSLSQHFHYIHDFRSGKVLGSLSGITCAQQGTISPDGTKIYGSAGNPRPGVAHVAKEYDSTTGKFLREVAELGGAIAISNDGRLLAGEGNDHNVVVAEIATSQVQHTLQGMTEPLVYLEFSPDAQRLITVSDKSVMRMWDLASGKELWKLDKTQLTQGPGYNPMATWLPNGKSMLTCGGDSMVRQWNAETGESEGAFSVKTPYVRSFAISHDGNKLIVSSQFNGLIKLWDLTTQKEIARYVGHTEVAKSAQFSPDEKMIVSCGFSDGTIRIWPVPD